MMLWIAALTGANTVICRYLNAAFARHNGLSMGTLANYATGLITSLVVLLCMGEAIGFAPLQTAGLRTVMMFLGGAVGVAVVQLLIYVTPRMPALLSSMLLFVSQLGAGIVLDAVLTGAFSRGKLIGGLMVLAGLWHYQWVARRAA